MSRGRQAKSPVAIPALGWKDVALRVKDAIAKDRIGLMAAGVAFYGLLALFPAITALIAISGLLIDPGQIAGQIQSLSGLLPQEVIGIISDQASAVAGSRDGGLKLAALLGLLIALYSASRGMASLMEGINVAYDEDEKRGFIKRMLVTLALTIVLIVGLLIAFATMIAVPAIIAILNLGPILTFSINAALWAGLVALTMLGLSVLYRFAPSRSSPEWKWASVGAFAGCVAWIIASVGFAFYVSNFGSYNESFGTLAGVVVLLMWFWISAFIVLLGAELNGELEAQTRVDTTVGPDKPMGQRGAVKADNLGAAAGE